ncbi:MAG: HAMP domain-containing histidine kinase [Acidimicrobiia bacterium]|nr:HAMP domain-containing histidine kinase [Acidimicrobiia bacterium]
MSGVTDKLWVRLLAAQLLIVALGAFTLVVLVEFLAPSFFTSDIRSMNEMMANPDSMADMMGGGMITGEPAGGFLTPGFQASLGDAFDSSFRRALAISLTVAGVASVGVTAFATRRILKPLEEVRLTTHRLAEGAYDQRIELPGEAELAALAADVNALAEALETTEQRRVRLISEVAHELRTPLTTLEGYLEGLLDGVFEPNEEVYAAAGRELHRLERLAADLADLSRAEEASQPLEPEPFDLAELAREVVAGLQVQAEAKEIQLIAADLPSTRVLADRDRITQVITNIVGNAITYTELGGKVTLTGGTDHGDAVLDVRDTGRGLTGDQQKAVFDRFYRVDRSGAGGSGIGLTIARSIARRHGGDITVSSQGPDKGSTFRLRLPSKHPA